MNDTQIDMMLRSLDLLARGVNKIGDGVKSVALYIWLPIYITLFVLFVAGVFAFVYFG